MSIARRLVMSPDRNGDAGFNLNCPDGPPVLRESFGFARHDLNAIAREARRRILRNPVCPGGPLMANPDPAPITGNEPNQAKTRLADRRKVQPHAVAARHDRRIVRIVIRLPNDLEPAFPPHLAQGLETARPVDLAEIPISPAGPGLRFPRLDADLDVPALLEGMFGSERRAAARMDSAIIGREGAARSQISGLLRAKAPMFAPNLWSLPARLP